MINKVRILVLFIGLIIVSVILALNLQTNYIEQGICLMLGFLIGNIFSIIAFLKQWEKHWKDMMFISTVMFVSMIIWGIGIIYLFSLMDWTKQYINLITNSAGITLHMLASVLALIIGGLTGSMGIADEPDYSKF